MATDVIDSRLAAPYNEVLILLAKSRRKFSMDCLVAPLLTSLMLSVGIPSSDNPQAEGLFLHPFKQAAVLRSQGEFERSFIALERALNVARRDQQEGQQGKCFVRMGILKWDLGDTTASKRYFEEAAISFAKCRDLRAREFCERCIDMIDLYVLGAEDRKTGFYHRSVGRLEKAITIGRELGIPDFQLKCLRQQSISHLALRRLGPFEACSRKGLEIAMLIKHRAEESRCLNNLGVFFQQKGDYSQAIDYFKDALSLIHGTGDKITEAECLNNLGLVFRESGNLSRAHEFLSRALEIDEAVGNGHSIAMDLDNLGSVKLRMGLEDQNAQALQAAIDTFKASRSLLSRGPTPELVSFSAINNMGVALHELGARAEARQCFIQALNALEAEGHLPERCMVLNNLGASYLGEYSIEKAFSFYRSSLEISLRHSFWGVLLEAYVGIGQCYERNDDPIAALASYQKAVEVIENMRSRLSSETFLIGLTKNTFGAYERAIHLLRVRRTRRPDGGALKEIFDLMERAKARVFLESVNNARLDGATADRQLLEQRLRAISHNISGLSLRLSENDGPDDERGALKTELELEEEEYVRLVSEWKEISKGIDIGSWRNEIRSLNEIQQLLLPESAVLLEYFLGETESFLLSISPGSADLHVLPPRRRIEDSLRGYLKLISERSSDPRAGLEAARRIGRELIPVQTTEGLRKAKALIVIPDGVLNYLPFETLMVGDKDDSSILIENIAVSYCPSASSIAALKEPPVRPLRPKEILAVGSPNYRVPRMNRSDIILRGREDIKTDMNEKRQEFIPLPFSEGEVRSIAKLYSSGAVDVLTGDEASEEKIKSIRLQDYRIIHFACHGIFDESHPFRSALALSVTDDPREDGMLQMREIYGFTLSADLVVLSACQTGRGRLRSSEGLMALARPFFFAGARAVIASLWSINDRATVAFMREFYARLIEGSSVAEALRHAKIWMLGSDWAHPYYWAGFLLHGNPSTSGKTN